MMENCFICAGLEKSCCGEGNGRSLGPKAIQTLIKTSKERGDSLHLLAEKNGDTAWTFNSCYRNYTSYRRSFDNTVKAACSSPRKTKSSRGSLAYDYKTHCLICEEVLDFVDAKKHPDRIKSKISCIEMVEKNKKCKLQKTLKKFCAGKTDPLSVEVVSKLEYAQCLRAYKAKYHRDCLQRFINGVSVIDTKVNKRNYNKSKGKAFQMFCEWYEGNEHDTTSMTLFGVQNMLEGFSETDEEVYTIKQISRKLKDRYGEEIQFTSSIGRPSIMLLKEEADAILTENILDDDDQSLSDMQEFISVGKVIRQRLLGILPNEDHDGEEPDDNKEASPEIVDGKEGSGQEIHESHVEQDTLKCQESQGEENQHQTTQEEDGEVKFYPYASDLKLDELLSAVPSELSSLLDAVFPSSRSESSEHKKTLRKTVIAHVIMQWCKKEGYISPLLLAIGLFIHQVTRSHMLIDVLYALGLSLLYTAIFDFEKSAEISMLEFKETLTDDELIDLFLQFIADNLDHNEDTVTGANTTHVME